MSPDREPAFSRLFAPFSLRNRPLANRIVFSSHATGFVEDGHLSDSHVAYYAARAAGGVGMIISEMHAVHPSGSLPKWLQATDDGCIPHLARLAEAVHAHGTLLASQIFYPGRVTLFREDGLRKVFYGAADTPDERFRQVPRAMPDALIEEVIASYGDAAARIERAGLDGVEIQAAFSYLPSHFLNPRTNTRTDRWGGSFENRLRFTRRLLADIRAKTGPDFLVGLRWPADEMDYDGITPEESIEAAVALAPDGMVDWFNLGSGSDSSIGGWAAAVPPAPFAHGMLGGIGRRLKAAVDVPVIVAGRINQPQIAEAMLERGEADLIGIARALIADPEFAAKARDGRLDDIRACVGCNQACIGHRENASRISCIQWPESGREARFLPRSRTASPRSVLVAGGGPGGMKAAVVAAERGHRVVLCEAGPELGGQVRLARMLPGREEFGGVITNLERELALAQVEIRRNTAVTPKLVRALKPDRVIAATGSLPRAVTFEGHDQPHVVGSWDAIAGRATIGGSVVIADWRCDWVGMGLAERLAREGRRVRLAVQGMVAGELVQSMVRERWMGDLHRLGVEILPYLRLYGTDSTTVFFQHTASGEPVILEDADTLIHVQSQASVTGLAEVLEAEGVTAVPLGDALLPRTVEEAIYEGLVAATSL